VVTLAGIVLLLALVTASDNVLAFLPGLASAIAGTILVSVVVTGNRAYAWAMVALVVFGLIGLGAATLLPAKVERA
jgi:hypothetical protein